VTDRNMLVHFYHPDGNYTELFDMEKDPQQLKSVYGLPEYAATQKELQKELLRLRTELKDTDETRRASVEPSAKGKSKDRAKKSDSVPVSTE